MSKALLVIDYVYSFIFPKKYQGINYNTDKIKLLYKNLQKLIDYCRINKIEVIWIIPIVRSKTQIPDNLMKVLERTKSRTLKGVRSRSNEIYKLKPLESEKVFDKTYYSAFSGTEGRLNNYLKSRGIKTLLISGIYSTTCVDATITEAFGRGYELEIFENCIETIGTPFSQKFQKDLLIHWSHKYGQIKTLKVL